MLLKTTMAYQLQNEHYIFMHYLFSQPAFFLSSQQMASFIHPQDIVSLMVYDKIVRKQLTFNLYIPMLRNYLAYFFQNSQIQNRRNLVGAQLNLFTTFHVFFFRFIFVLPARYMRICNFTGKPKQMQVSSILQLYPLCHWDNYSIDDTYVCFGFPVKFLVFP